jgi:hypothetical protein
MMREYETIMCFLNWPKELKNSQGESRVRGGFKVIPRISKLHGYNTLEETPLVKSNHGYKINTHHIVEIPRQVAILEFTKKTSK